MKKLFHSWQRIYEALDVNVIGVNEGKDYFLSNTYLWNSIRRPKFLLGNMIQIGSDAQKL